MTVDLIEKFIETKKRKNRHITIHFKQRDTLTGIFIRTNDYSELKGKNFWRVVVSSKMEEWEKTGNPDLARIFSGTEFTRLSENEENNN